MQRQMFLLAAALAACGAPKRSAFDPKLRITTDPPGAQVVYLSSWQWSGAKELCYSPCVTTIHGQSDHKYTLVAHHPERGNGRQVVRARPEDDAGITDVHIVLPPGEPEYAPFEILYDVGPPPPLGSMLVMHMRAAPGSAVDSGLATGQVVDTLQRLNADPVQSMDALNAMLEFEKVKDQVGCDEMSCLVEIGKTLGVDVVVAGRVSSAGNIVTLTLSAFSPTRGVLIGSASSSYGSGDDPVNNFTTYTGKDAVVKLFESLRRASKERRKS